MLIYIVSKSFWPLNKPRAFRATELALEFARLGHEVVVFTIGIDKGREEFAHKHGLKVRELGPLSWSQVSSFIKLGSFGYFIDRLFSWLFEFPQIELSLRIKKNLAHSKKADLLISIGILRSKLK